MIPRAHVDLSGPHYFHAAAAQGNLADATQRIRINSSIAILPLQHPIVTAKALAMIDWLSGDRAIATFGVGWLEREFDLLGVPSHQRGTMSQVPIPPLGGVEAYCDCTRWVIGEIAPRLR